MQESTASDRMLLDQTIAEYSRCGWQVVSRTPTSVQVRKPRQWDRVGVVIIVLLVLGGLFWTPLFGAALIGGILEVASYMIQQEAVEFITAEQLRSAAEQQPRPPT